MKKKEKKKRRRRKGKKKSARLAEGVKRYQLYATLMNVPLETVTGGREGERERKKREPRRSTWLDCFNDRLYARAFVHARCASRKPHESLNNRCLMNNPVFEASATVTVSTVTPRGVYLKG